MKFQWLALGAVGVACVAAGSRPLAAQPWPPAVERTATVLTVDVPVPELPWTPQQEQKWALSLEAARAQGPFKMLLRQFQAPHDPPPWEAAPPADAPPAQAPEELPDVLGGLTRLQNQGAGNNAPIVAGAALQLDLLTEAAPVQAPQAEAAPGKLWSYMEPCWYQWRDRIVAGEAPPAMRAWGPEQAAGAPNTPEAGDIRTAWASRTPDGGPEWLMLEFPDAVVPSALRVRETFNPGAISRVTMFALDGSEVEVWAGTSPTREVKDGPAVFELRFGPDLRLGQPAPGPHVPLKTNRVKLYLDSAAVPGWNEIDAVSLVAADNKERDLWATSAAASSTYAEPAAAPPVLAPFDVPGALAPDDGAVAPGPPPDGDLAQRVRQLEAEVKALRDEVQALRERAGQPVREPTRLK